MRDYLITLFDVLTKSNLANKLTIRMNYVL